MYTHTHTRKSNLDVFSLFRHSLSLPFVSMCTHLEMAEREEEKVSRIAVLPDYFLVRSTGGSARREQMLRTGGQTAVFLPERKIIFLIDGSETSQVRMITNLPRRNETSDSQNEQLFFLPSTNGWMDGERGELVVKIDLLRVDKCSNMPFSSLHLVEPTERLISSYPTASADDLAAQNGCYRRWKDNKQSPSVCRSKQKNSSTD